VQLPITSRDRFLKAAQFFERREREFRKKQEKRAAESEQPAAFNNELRS
jgi:hypothetical protein